MKTINEAAKKYAEPRSSAEIFRRSHIADFMAGVEFAQRWIPVEEELPNKEIQVLYKNSIGEIGTAFYSQVYQNTYWIGNNGKLKNKITHWRPIELK